MRMTTIVLSIMLFGYCYAGQAPKDDPKKRLSLKVLKDNGRTIPEKKEIVQEPIRSKEFIDDVTKYVSLRREARVLLDAGKMVEKKLKEEEVDDQVKLLLGKTYRISIIVGYPVVINDSMIEYRTGESLRYEPTALQKILSNNGAGYITFLFYRFHLTDISAGSIIEQSFRFVDKFAVDRLELTDIRELSKREEEHAKNREEANKGK